MIEHLLEYVTESKY